MITTPFISYAQNREDVILWRALSHISNGFYIDVGANHPTDDSVTKAFYERGWNGINIEPLPLHVQQLHQERTRDINLGIAAGSYEGHINIFDTPIRGWATASQITAKTHRESGLDVTEINVPISRLDTIWEQYVDRPVNFLKIDVEGFEEEVLKGLNLLKHRPWIIIIEATKPNSPEIEANWDALITDHSYSLVYFDGLNRYYLSEEHSDLSKYFNAPANVFDHYISAEEFRISQSLLLEQEKSEKINLQLIINKKILEKQIYRFSQLEKNYKENESVLKNQINAIYSSHSWRITASLRELSKLAKNFKNFLKKRKTIKISIEQTKKNFDNKDSSKKFHQKSFKFSPNIQEYQSHKLRQKKIWRVVGHLEGHYSLSIVNRGLAIALNKSSANNLHFVAWHGKQYVPGDDIPVDQAEDLRKILDQIPVDNDETISLVHHYPLIVDPRPAKLRLTLFFWEESRVPELMINHLNQHTDAVLVSSQFVQRCLRYSGYKKPILIIPIGLPNYILESPIPNAPKVPHPGQLFRFLHISSGFERKGLDILLKSYFQNFSKNDNVELYIKTFPNPHQDIQSLVKKWQDAYPDGAKISVDLRELSESEMLGIYSNSHAMVLPTRGEGFGLPAAEAMALGLPVITTGFGGHTDFCTHQTAFLIPYTFEYSKSHLRSDGSYWAEPDCHDLSTQMLRVRDLVLSKDPGISMRCKAALNWCRENYQWEKSANAIDSIAEQILDYKNENKNKRKKIFIISPWNTKCGVAEYTQSLLDQWENFFDIEVYCDTRTENNREQKLFNPHWEIGNDDDIIKILEEILFNYKNHPNALLIQHQPSLFTLNSTICELLLKIENSGISVILELHSTLPLARERRLSVISVSSLSKISLIVVHKIDDINHMNSIGLSNNTMLLPLGINQIDNKTDIPERKDFNIAEKDIVLGCFGFLWAHKGVDSVIRSLVDLNKKSNHKFKLLAVTATPDKNSLELLEQYKKLSEDLGVKDYVIWVTDFLPIQKSLKILSLADFQIFAYGPSSESASAAVTIGLATQKAVLVSNEPIFSDLSDYTYQLSGNSENNISKAVLYLINNPEEWELLRNRQIHWLEERAWPKVSLRLRNVISGLLEQKSLKQPRLLTMPKWPEKKQILVDVSELVLRDAGTGIQRVVRSILNEWLTCPPSGYVVRAVCAEKNKKYIYTSKFLAAEDKENQYIDGKNVEVNPGDIFVGLDLSAHLFPEIESQLHFWRLQGVLVCYVIYDIIPLLYPEKVISQLIPAFETWMRSLVKEADRLICISESVEKDLVRWLSNKHTNLVLPEVSHFHLGANFPANKDVLLSKELSDLLSIIKSKTTFLMVGTVEPRKGYSQALSAMDFLWNSNKDLHLVIVGKRGWMVDSLCERLDKHSELGKRLHWFENANDDLLVNLYKNCTALLAASEAEGFGLPLIEAAQYGLPIIARDIDVFKEIAKDYAFYFATSDAGVLSSYLEAWIDLHAKGFSPKSQDMSWLSWKESAKQLWEAIQ